MVIGIDHGFSFPQTYFSQHNLSSWEDLLNHLESLWGYTKRAELSSQSEGLTSYSNRNELRLTEKYTSSAKSVFDFKSRVTVAYSTHTGLPWFHQLRKEFGSVLHFWPFDGLIPPEEKTVIAEVYPALFYRRYSYPDSLKGNRDAQDAYAIAAWMQEHDKSGHLDIYMRLPTLEPDDIDVVFREGWILGIL